MQIGLSWLKVVKMTCYGVMGKAEVTCAAYILLDQNNQIVAFGNRNPTDIVIKLSISAQDLAILINQNGWKAVVLVGGTPHYTR